MERREISTLACYTDGASRGNPGPSACAYILVTSSGDVVEECAVPLNRGTNNEAEYRGLLAGLSAAERLGTARLEVFSDSELMIRQMAGTYRVSSPRLRPLYEEAQALIRHFREVTFQSVPREHPLIARADRLCNQVLDAGRGRAERQGP
jgi:ribonuclease HI